MPATTFTKVHDGRSYGYSMTGPKWRCDVCGRTGYGLHGPYSWADSCRRGHLPCSWCGRMITVRLDGTARVHARCPERPTAATRLWVEAKDAKAAARVTHAIGDSEAS